MHVKPLLLLLLGGALLSCSESRREAPVVASTPPPEAFTETDVYSTGKRYDTDLLDAVYREQVAKSPGLQALEKDLSALREAGSDSTDVFRRFHNNNLNFYASALRHAEAIGDTVLRNRMRDLVQRSRARYDAAAGRNTGLLNGIDTLSRGLGMLHEAVRIAVAVPVIERYARENMPPASPMEGHLARQQKMQQRLTDSLDRH